ncbi:MAG TPA: hypothetical protein VIY48_12560 [Candidatus Paceibacterota bacterium]
MSETDGVGIGELSRQVRDVFLRFEALAARLETQFVRADNFELYKVLINTEIAALKTASEKLTQTISTLPSSTEIKDLKERVDDLEDDKKWLTRLILGFIILGVLGAVYTVSQLK